MLIRHRDRDPVVHPSAWVAPTAVLVGDVTVGPRARILYGAVLSAEGSRVEIGECAIVGENAVLRALRAPDEEFPVVVGNHVFIGPHATLLGCRVEPCAYLATGSAALQGSIIRTGAVIAVNAVVHARAVAPVDMFLPPGTIAIGDPARVYSPDERVTLASALKSLRFGKIAYGIEAFGEERAALYREITETRSREYAEHERDVVIPSGPGDGGREPR